MAKQTYVYSGTEWVPLASEVTNLTAYQTKALAQASNRNLIINGAMQVAQRGTSTTSITTGAYRTVDRFIFSPSNQGTWTETVENDAPTGSGFRKSLKVLCTTADASPAAGDYVFVDHTFEGQNLQAIKKGTAAAEQLTLSFWVKSNVTGTYIAELYDQDNSRQVSKSYSISTSATWEKKTLTFPADTTGAFDNDNALSCFLRFWLGAGSDFTSGTLNSSVWASPTTANRAAGQTNLASATNNYWQITGVQLEVGDTATPFEFKPIDEDLRQCQRYYEKSYDLTTVPGTSTEAGALLAVSPGNVNRVFASIQLRVSKRGQPTYTIYSTTGASGNMRDLTAGADKAVNLSTTAGENGVGIVTTAGITATTNTVAFQYVASAEL